MPFFLTTVINRRIGYCVLLSARGSSDIKNVWLMLKCTLISRYGFGNAGNPTYGIPGGATLQYKIKLNAFEKVSESK